LLSSYGGLSSDNFVTATNNTVSVWLRARNASSSNTIDPTPDSNNQYKLAGPDVDDFAFEFQFTPAGNDTVAGTNYWLKLEIDGDPSSATDFTSAGVTFSQWIFDDNDNNGKYVRSPNGDIDDRNDDGDTDDPGETAWETCDDTGELITDGSWDDGDSMVIDGLAFRNGPNSDGTVQFTGSGDLPEYVVVNSWKPKWWIGEPGPGLYDLKFTAYDGDPDNGGALLASVDARAQVVPEPATLSLLAVAGVGVLLKRRKR